MHWSATYINNTWKINRCSLLMEVIVSLSIPTSHYSLSALFHACWVFHLSILALPASTAVFNFTTGYLYEPFYLSLQRLLTFSALVFLSLSVLCDFCRTSTTVEGTAGLSEGQITPNNSGICSCEFRWRKGGESMTRC
jgi:hypothetical protein